MNEKKEKRNNHHFHPSPGNTNSNNNSVGRSSKYEKSSVKKGSQRSSKPVVAKVQISTFKNMKGNTGSDHDSVTTSKNNNGPSQIENGGDLDDSKK
jgi:hypothetical protein